MDHDSLQLHDLVEAFSMHCKHTLRSTVVRNRYTYTCLLQERPTEIGVCYRRDLQKIFHLCENRAFLQEKVSFAKETSRNMALLRSLDWTIQGSFVALVVHQEKEKEKEKRKKSV